jgi:trans-2-enoyl-CoA reductase
MKTTSLVLKEYGLIDITEIELPQLTPSQVLLEMKAASINPADLNMIEGKYPVDQDLPFTLGMEGVGVVSDVGSAINDLEIGQVVLPVSRPGAWSLHRILERDDVVPISSELSYEQACMLIVNPPTAWGMIHDFVSLKPGDWIVQNAANSAVGQYVIHFANALGFKTANVVRREESIQPLQDIGADIVILESERFSKVIKQESKNASIKLGFNAVGGANATEIARSLDHGGTMVTYGAMSMQPVTIPNGLLIFKDIRFAGYWIKLWYQRAKYDEKCGLFDRIMQILLDRKVQIPIAQKFSIEKYTDALSHAAQSSRNGKVIFKF